MTEDCEELLSKIRQIRSFASWCKLSCFESLNQTYFSFIRRLGKVKTDVQAKKLKKAIKRELDFWENHPQIKSELWRIY